LTVDRNEVGLGCAYRKPVFSELLRVSGCGARKKILEKLGLHGTADLILYAVTKGVVSQQLTVI
jgi:hypothetical protein